jgi:ferrous iron transport protein B
MYMKKAGTVILSASILIWAITTFPVYEMSGAEKAEITAAFNAENPSADSGALEKYLESVAAQNSLQGSIAGQLGHFIEPVFRPMGFDWKIAVASVTGFAAKEVIVSTLGILYRVGGGEEEENAGLRDAIRNDSHMRPLVAFVFMLFTLIIPPCFAALAAMKAEIGPKWVAFEIGFLFALGWLLCFIVYQAGSLAGF